ncbi:MAG: GNAT family N-acetyltransferase [Sphaerochaeta sp.]|jgi:PAS domain S-box-containing protein|uniref:GNAT family N-acetyltransferase n=1 Tax=Sphaerochaeta sp. TaxID=1972642 RepID=UPI002A35B3C6|nr:GNAT family N-acetyltransferase [Sphaerochaeta sp.]MDX9825312.1 GNAT family N-acetyltransferase [Sphaerochaeta sp.]
MIIDVSTIIPAVAFVLYVSFVIFGFLQYKKDRFYWSFQLYMIFVSIWSFGSMMMHLNSPIQTPLFWNRIMLIGLLSVPYALCSFVVDILEIQKRMIFRIINLSYILIIPLMYLNFSGNIVSDAGFTAQGEFYYQLAPGALSAYSLSYVYLIFTLVMLLFGAKRRSSQGFHKNLVLPLIGVAIMLVGIFMNVFPKFGRYPIDIFAATINAVLLFYTIYKYKLINYSRVGLSIIYSTILAAAASVVYLLIFSFIQHNNTNFDPGNIFQLSFILGVATVLIIHPLRNLLSYLVDTVIIPKRHPYQTTIKNLSKRLTTIVNLHDLGNEVVKSLSTGLKTEWVVFVAKRYDESRKFFLVANNNCPSTCKIGQEIVFSFSEEVEQKLELYKKENQSSVISVNPDEQRMEVSSSLPPADVLIPLVFRKQIAGYILIGYDHTKALISEIEREALEILAAQSSLSLENALSFEQLRIQGDELTMSKNKLEAIFNGIASPVCLIDIDYTIQEANTAAVSFFGQDRETLIGGKCYRSFFHRSRPCPFCQGLECLHTGVLQETEADVAEQVFSFQFHSVRSPDKSKSKGVFIEIINDITEQKHMQEELVRTEKMAGIGTLAAGIAHELNNPLAGIVGTAEIMLSEMDEQSPHHEYVQDILTYSKTASDVIKELSIYSRKEEVKQTQQVEIVRVLEFSLRLALRGVDSQNIRVERNYHALPSIEANEGKLQQLFLNLIVNAIQAMNGNGKLTLSCVEKDGFVQVKVGDTGCGIPEKHMSQIFTPFFTTKAPGSGTGLGLSNCYNIVEKMGGRIRVKSEENVGSEFTIIFALNEENKENISFQLVNDQNGMNDVFFIQRKVLVGEKGYLEESIHRKVDEKAMHILAFRGLHPVGTVSLMTSEHFWPLPISKYFDIQKVLKTRKAAEIIRLAVLPEMRNTSASIGLIILVFLLARATGVEELIIDVFADDEKTIKLYKKFGFVEVGTYNSPSAVTVMVLQSKSTLEKDRSQLRHFVRPLFSRLRTLFDFGPYTQAVHDEMDRILSVDKEEPVEIEAI